MVEMDNSFNPELLLILPFSWGVAISLGMIETTWIPFIDPGAVIFAPGNIQLTLGRIVAVLSLLAVFVNREVGFRATGFIDAWIVYATLGLILAPPLFPLFADTLAHGPAAFVAFTVQTTGFGIISYMN